MNERVLLTATPGGHLQELLEWVRRIADLPCDRVWVTARTPQTTSLLAGEDVIWVPPVQTRQLGRVLASVPLANAIARRVRPSMVVSTGAALTVPYVQAAILRGAVGHFIESATRTGTLSLSGRIMELTPGVRMHVQAPRGGSDPRWSPSGSLFESFAPELAAPTPIRKVVVTLGTERFDFSRAVRALVPLLPRGADILWQVGSTATAPPIGRAVTLLPHADLAAQFAEADLVVTHAGVGSVLTALDAGQCPLVLPRASRYAEHVDDHQLDLGATLVDRSLAVVRDPYRLSGDDLAEAAARRTARRADAPRLCLRQGSGETASQATPIRPAPLVLAPLGPAPVGPAPLGPGPLGPASLGAEWRHAS